jgi:hypothetical protein
VGPLLFQLRTSDTAGDFDRQVQAVYADLLISYIEPESQPAALTAGTCPSFEPGSNRPDCAKLVDVLAAGHPALESGIQRLSSILAGVSSDVPSTDVVAVRGMVDALKHLYDSDGLLIQGWRNNDQASWDSGWKTREELRDKIIQSIALSTPTKPAS